MTDSLHILYAVLDTIHGPHRVRISRSLDWHTAAALHDSLHGRSGSGYGRPVVSPGYSVYGRPVRFLAVRAADDPAWPAHRPCLTLTNDRELSTCSA